MKTNTDEQHYLDCLREIIKNGRRRDDRTGTGTLSIFGMQKRYSLRNGVIPLITTKRVFWRGIVEELLWFIRGDTNSKTLSAKGVKIWDANGSREFLDNCGFHGREEGDLGPIYGFQWRHFGAQYETAKTDYGGKGVDQLANVIHQIKQTPDSRRIIMCAWNVADLNQMALPPCHALCQFYVCDGELSCQLYQRSADMGLGVPFNIASYALLTHMLAKLTNLKPGEFIHTMGDAHLYVNHLDGVNTQLEREPRPFPTIRFVNDINTIEDFTAESIVLENYSPHPKIDLPFST